MKYKHIVFDIDGTLIDTEYAVINSLIKTITEITGRAPQYESLKFALGITGRNALELLKIPDIEDALKRWDRNMKLLQHTIQPFQGGNQYPPLAGSSIGIISLEHGAFRFFNVL